MAGRLELGVLRPYWHVLQCGGHRAPTHHAVNPGPHSITLFHYTWSEGSFLHVPAPDASNQLRRRRSQDQAHSNAAQAERRRRGACCPSMINAMRSSAGPQDQAHVTAAEAERRRRGACFPSIINAVLSSADAAQDFKDQRAFSLRAALTRRRFSASLQGPADFFFASSAYSSRAASTRRKFSASLQGPAGFFFASSLDTTQIQRKPSRTSTLLVHEQPPHDATCSHGATTGCRMR